MSPLSPHIWRATIGKPHDNPRVAAIRVLSSSTLLMRKRITHRHTSCHRRKSRGREPRQCCSRSSIVITTTTLSSTTPHVRDRASTDTPVVFQKLNQHDASSKTWRIFSYHRWLNLFSMSAKLSVITLYFTFQILSLFLLNLNENLSFKTARWAGRAMWTNR